MSKQLTEIKVLDSKTFIHMLEQGVLSLTNHMEEVNDLNVFPVPDGDTGTNMRRTIQGGYDVIIEDEKEDLSKTVQDLSRGMLLSARGNSGVILSQIFRGFSKGILTKKTVATLGLSLAFKAAVKQAYTAVVKPVEGTILTVLREAVNVANKNLTVNIYQYLVNLYKAAVAILPKTKDMLPVLKEADVVDSGGAGLVYIFKGFVDYFEGRDNRNATSSKIIEEHEEEKTTQTSLDFSLFNENSVLDYGYCTEFILQLTKSKVEDIENFSENTVIEYLSTVGDSIVCLKDGSVIKAHVHTKDPGIVFHTVQQWGEFLTMKCENMSLQHNNVVEHKASKPAPKKQAHKKYASVVVAQGEGITNAFEELGIDYVVSGQQTMNPSSEDFIEAFDAIDADNIIVLPNNSNIILTAEQAATLYMEDHPEVQITVIKTKSIAQGYVAASMFMFDDNSELSNVVDDIYDSIKDVHSLEITTATRDTVVKGVKVTQGHCIGILNHELVADHQDKIDCLDLSLSKIENMSNRDFILIIYGKDMSQDDKDKTKDKLHTLYPSVEIGELNGGQDVYSYIIAVS